jgi:hypothetical protein
MKMKTKKTYEVNADGDRSFASGSKAKVMSVAKAWRKQGAKPQAYAIAEDSEGRVVCDRIEIK